MIQAQVAEKCAAVLGTVSAQRALEAYCRLRAPGRRPIVEAGAGRDAAGAETGLASLWRLGIANGKET
ncbi:hypothetical protein, partial [Mesorhizobium sp. M8A.F.Ca.ET.167.01.1.1]|uniref:hypothetical protein n=1 Tax=Mesorhizobium sp. M8A.F.Ca.ET.167.01.1.1 TaxID=2563961 RepID=UPI001AEE0EB2